MCCHDIMYFSNFLGFDTMAQIELVTIEKLIETNTDNSVVCICLSHIKERVEVSGQHWPFSMQPFKGQSDGYSTISTQISSKISPVIVMLVRQKEKRAQQEAQEARSKMCKWKTSLLTHILPETTLTSQYLTAKKAGGTM